MNENTNPVKYIYSGTQLAITILLMFYLGYYLDKKFGTHPYLTVACASLGIAAGMYNFIKIFYGTKKSG